MRDWTEEQVREYAEFYADSETPWEPHEIKLDLIELRDRGDNDFLTGLGYNEFNEFAQQVIDRHWLIVNYEREA